MNLIAPVYLTRERSGGRLRRSFGVQIRRWSAAGARAVTLSLLSIYVIATLGVPLPVAPQKATDQPFPCQGHACGCLSAAACWSDCCCSSRADKLAWARKHGVTPPQEFLAKATTCEACSKQKTCCAALRHAPPTRLTTLLMISAAKCRGLHFDFSTGGVTIVAQPVSVLPSPVIGWQEVVWGMPASKDAPLPLVPPPQAYL